MPGLRSLVGGIVLGVTLPSALPAQGPDSSLVTLDRVFNSDEFAPERIGAVRWLDGQAA
jgi:hypothetical protein